VLRGTRSEVLGKRSEYFRKKKTSAVPVRYCGYLHVSVSLSLLLKCSVDCSSYVNSSEEICWSTVGRMSCGLYTLYLSLSFRLRLFSFLAGGRHYCKIFDTVDMIQGWIYCAVCLIVKHEFLCVRVHLWPWVSLSGHADTIWSLVEIRINLAVTWLVGLSPRRTGFTPWCSPGSTRDLWWVKWYWDRFLSEFLGFSSHYHSIWAVHTHIMWGMNNRHVRGRSSETWSRPINMNNNNNKNKSGIVGPVQVTSWQPAILRDRG
jgi:hypothetical protein